MKLLIKEPQTATRNEHSELLASAHGAVFYQPGGSLQNTSDPELQLLLPGPPPKPSEAGISLTISPPSKAPAPQTDLLVEGRGVGSHSEVGLGAFLLDVLQAVPIAVHYQMSGVIEENSNAVVTQLVT